MAIVSRYLGISKFGELSYAVGLYSAFEVVLQLKNSELFRKRIIVAKDPENFLIQTINSYFIVCIFLFFLLNIFVWVVFTLNVDIKILITFMGCSLFFRISDFISHYKSAFLKNKDISLIEIVGVVTNSFTKLLLVFFKAGLPFFAIPYLLQKITHFFCHVKTINLYNMIKSKRNSLKIWIDWEFVRASLPLFFAASCVVIINKTDQLMIGSLVNYQEVGNFNISLKLYNSWGFISVIIGQVFFPFMVRYNLNNNHEQQYRLIESLCSFFCFLFVLIFLFMGIFSREIVIRIFSEEYLGALKFIQVHSATILFMFFMHLTLKFEVVKSLQKVILIKSVLTCLLNLLLNYCLILNFGSIGACYATLISLLFYSLLLNFFFVDLREMFWSQLKSFMFWRFQWYNLVKDLRKR